MAFIAPIPWHAAPRSTLAALRGRGAHALLLHGPTGTGKWELAMSYARDLLCERGSGTACGSCPSCVLSAAGNHPDLRVIVPDAFAWRRPGAAQEGEEQIPEPLGEASSGKSKPSREIKIDQVRELTSLTAISAHRGGCRVIVLAPAESLNLPAANALLKGLEEPPPATVFLLISDRLDRCLPTIVSRCALVRITIPPRALALQWLYGQGVGADAPQRLTEAGGAPLAALRLEEHALAPDVRAALLHLLRRGPSLEPADVANDVPRTVSIDGAVALFQRWGWDYFAFRMGCALRYHPADVASFEVLSHHWTLRAASGWMDRLSSLRAVAEHPLNARAAIEGLLLEYIGSIAVGHEKTVES